MFRSLKIKMNNGDIFYMFPRKYKVIDTMAISSSIGKGGDSLVNANTANSPDSPRVYINANNISHIEGQDNQNA